MPPAESDERARVLALLKRHGWHVTSFQVLEPQFHYRIDGEGCVAYAPTRTAWVAAGAPIADRAEVPARMREFTAAAASEGKRARFFAIERAFVPEGFRAVAIGARPVWDPSRWEEVLRSHRSLREQVRRARAKQVTVRRATAGELAEGAPLRSRVEALISRWLRSKPMPAMGFLVDVQPFAFGEERRYFVAEQGEKVVGFLAAVPVYARNGWLLEDLLRDPSAPNGVTELLVDAAMRTFAQEGSRFATLGQVPLAGIERGWLKAIRDRSRWLYDFEGLRAFKSKLRPDTWEELCLAFPEGDNEARAVFDTLAAFAHGSFLRFGVNTVLHAAPLTARALAIALVPWTALLAIAPAEVWFPSAAVKWGWVGFDVFMAAALLWLSVRWRTALATLLASLATLDAILTLVQALTFNVPRAHGPLSWLAIAAGVCAPIVASAFLWRARRHGAEPLRA
jgi:phosphatidylglycerol lysyltransferase